MFRLRVLRLAADQALDLVNRKLRVFELDLHAGQAVTLWSGRIPAFLQRVHPLGQA